MEGVMNNLYNYYFLPPAITKLTKEFYERLDAAALTLYAFLYTKTLIFDHEDSPGTLLGDDGRRLFITYAYEDLVRELEWHSGGGVKDSLEVLTRLTLVNVVEQRNGMPHVIFVFSPEHTDLLQSGNSMNEITDAHIVAADNDEAFNASDCDVVDTTDDSGAGSIVECWVQVFGEYPDAEGDVDVLNALLSYLPDMDISVIKYALFAMTQDNKRSFGFVTEFLEECKKSGVKHFDEIEEIVDTSAPDIADESAKVSEPVSAHADADSLTFANRITALIEACNNEFTALDINEVWVSMQEVVDATFWEDYSYLHNWLKAKYGLMDARVKGGERVVRLNMLMRIIADD
jgi:hypothetical protein